MAKKNDPQALNQAEAVSQGGGQLQVPASQTNPTKERGTKMENLRQRLQGK